MHAPELVAAEQDLWSSLACSQTPEYHLTLTLSRPYSDHQSIEALAFAMRSIQRRIPSRRSLRGIASFERTWKNARFEGTLHLHCLLWGVVNNVTDPDQFLSEISEQAASRLRDNKGRPMTNASSVLLRRVDEAEIAAHYVTKDLNRCDENRRPIIRLITKHGIDIHNFHPIQDLS